MYMVRKGSNPNASIGLLKYPVQTLLANTSLTLLWFAYTIIQQIQNYYSFTVWIHLISRSSIEWKRQQINWEKKKRCSTGFHCPHTLTILEMCVMILRSSFINFKVLNSYQHIQIRLFLVSWMKNIIIIIIIIIIKFTKASGGCKALQLRQSVWSEAVWQSMCRSWRAVGSHLPDLLLWRKSCSDDRHYYSIYHQRGNGPSESWPTLRDASFHSLTSTSGTLSPIWSLRIKSALSAPVRIHSSDNMSVSSITGGAN